MKTIQQAFSRANTSFADESLNSSGLAWYIDAAQETLEEIARECFLWQRSRWFYVVTKQPDQYPSLVSESVAAINYTPEDIQTVPDNVVRSFSPQPASAKTVQILPILFDTRSIVIPASENARYTIRVTRNGADCKEFPYATIQSSLDYNSPFWGNDTELADVAFATKLHDDESMEIFFAIPLAQNDYVYACYTTQRPAELTTVTANDDVPDWIFPALVEGIKWRLACHFFARGNDKMAPRLQMFEKNYQAAKYKTVDYSRNLRDRRSTIIMQPIKWLSDRTTQYY